MNAHIGKVRSFPLLRGGRTVRLKICTHIHNYATTVSPLTNLAKSVNQIKVDGGVSEIIGLAENSSFIRIGREHIDCFKSFMVKFCHVFCGRGVDLQVSFCKIYFGEISLAL